MSACVKLRSGVDYRTEDGLLYGGAVFKVSDAELKAFGDKFEIVDEPEPEEPEGELSKVDELPAEPPPLYHIDVTDAAYNMADKHDIDLLEVEGSGKEGRIIVPDVRAAIDG